MGQARVAAGAVLLLHVLVRLGDLVLMVLVVGM